LLSDFICMRCSPLFVFYGVVDLRVLRSFPTRRSSDLGQPVLVDGDQAQDLCDRDGRKREVGTMKAEGEPAPEEGQQHGGSHRQQDRKSTRLNSSHVKISYAVFCLKKKKKKSKMQWLQR